jgi:bifunctional non-homologous end joining protein LigD
VSFVAFAVVAPDGRPLIDLPLSSGSAWRTLDLGSRPGRVAYGETLPPWGSRRWRSGGNGGGVRENTGWRSADWQGAHLHTVKAVVGGFTAGEGGRAGTFGALVLGLWQEDRLRWIGNVGTGFSDRDLAAIHTALQEMSCAASPFHPDPELPKIVPVEPLLVAAVAYRNWTNAGRFRQPRFKGFAEDASETLTWESEGPSRPDG